jgi:hypothetical protein
LENTAAIIFKKSCLRAHNNNVPAKKCIEQSLEEMPQMKRNGKLQVCDTVEEVSLAGQESGTPWRESCNQFCRAIQPIWKKAMPSQYIYIYIKNRLHDDTTILAYVTDKGDAQGHGYEGQAAPEGPPNTASFFIVRLTALPQLGRFQTFRGGVVRDRRCFFRLKDQNRRRRR